jgi:hypothetical protein
MQVRMKPKRLKNVPRSAWLIVGVCITAIVMPTAAVATVLTYTGIKGTSGNKADVSTAGQVLTASATPANYYADADSGVTSPTPVAVATPPSGDGLVVTSVSISAYSVTSPGASVINLIVEPSGCTGYLGGFQHGVYPDSVGATELTFNPGIAIPSGDVLCAQAGFGAAAYVEVVGYTGSSASIP